MWHPEDMAARTGAGATRVYLEVTQRRTFAMALDWPGWGRAGKTSDAALAALADYAPRFAPVAKLAKITFPARAGADLTVVEELTGNATTEFGAPAIIASGDTEPWGGAEAKRAVALLRASWQVLATTAANSPAGLRKGPRGGGRDRDKMLDHVLGAEVGYGRMIGIKRKQPALDDQDAITALRDEILAVLAAANDGSPLRPNGWPARYAARRFTWHVLDHAWEMADRRE